MPISSGLPIVLAYVAFVRSTVLPTGGHLAVLPGLRSPLQTTSITLSCGSPFASTMPLMIWIRSRFAPLGSFAAQTVNVGALAAFSIVPPIGTPLR